MQPTIRGTITDMVGSQPCLLHAADFGWVHRARLYWGLPYDDLVEADRYEHMQPGALADDVHVVRWRGPPVPCTWSPPETWTMDGGGGLRGPMLPGSA